MYYLRKVTWSSYIHGCSSRLGYFPKGGTMRLKTRAIHTNTAGRTIWKHMNKIVSHRHVSQRCAGVFSVPEQRSPSWNAVHTGSVSTSEPQTAAASNSTPSPGTTLYLPYTSASPSPCSLTRKDRSHDQTRAHHYLCVCVSLYVPVSPSESSPSLSSSVNGFRQLWWSPPPKA